MSILICDICGTSYPDSEEKCPTCGYARAFDEAGMLADRPHAVHEKVRGGRFSRKNVRRRMKQKQEAGEEAQPVIVHHGAADLPEAEPDPVEQEQAAPVEIAAPEVSVPEHVEEEPAAEATPIPVAEPENVPEQTAGEEEKQKKLLAAYRRDVTLNLVLFFSVVIMLASAAYLIVNYGIPYLKEFTRPSQSVVMTDPPTDPPADPPTDPPTEEPTDPPADPPTDPPTDPPADPPTEEPTEEPTVALLNVTLRLNYYDLTFPTRGDITQLYAEGIPNADVTWISDDTGVVTVSDTGLITAVGGGKTTVRAIYGDQEVTVKINCRF